MKRLLFLCSALACTSLAFAQLTFNYRYGGDKPDMGSSIVYTPSGEYVVAGSTQSGGAGKADGWIMRITNSGEKVWEKYLGGAGMEMVSDMILTKEGDYLVIGYKQEAANTPARGWLTRLDPKGNVKWTQTYGGDKSDYASSAFQTADGGFVFVGHSNSYTNGKLDMWITKIDGNGRQLWTRNSGGKGDDKATSVIESREGDIYVGGYASDGDKGGAADMCLIKLDASGNTKWKKFYGGAGNESIEGMVEVMPGNKIAFTGWTSSKGNGKNDASIILTDKEGTIIWDKTYGSEGNDAFDDIILTSDGYLATAGYTGSFGVSESALWTLKMNVQGEVIWNKRTAGTRQESGEHIAEMKDKYLLTCGTIGVSEGNTDLWILRMDANGLIKEETTTPGLPLAVAAPKAEKQEKNLVPDAPKSSPVVAATTKPVEKSKIESIYTQPAPKKTETAKEIEDLYKPNLYVLAVGVSNYKDPKFNLTFAHTDADTVAEMFRTMEGKLYRKVEVKKLLNEEATLVNIKMAIQWMEEQATQKDVVLMYFSSHGALDSKGNLHILPHDFSPVSIFATGLNIKDITGGVNGVPCKKLVFMDACHSGQSGNDLLEFASLKDINMEAIVDEVAKADPGLTLMTSSSGKEYSYEKPSWRHGAFSKAILEGLRGDADFNHDTVINFAELNLYVSERVKTLTKGKQHPYTPINLFGNLPVFILK